MRAYSPHPRPMASTDLRRLFDSVEPLTVGLEEEVWLLDAETLDLLPRADDLLARLEGDPRFKPELPAAQLEIATAPAASAEQALQQLAAARRDLAAAAEGFCRLACSGVHPFAAPSGELNGAPRYAGIIEEYGAIARRQLVSALQVHVAVGGAERTLAVHNALREYLPDLAALAANAAVYEGGDTGLASVRPSISALLPRQNVPPVIESWDAHARALEALGEARLWWWELRPHPAYGTLEVRVPDAQASVPEAAAVVDVVCRLVGELVERADAGDLPPPVEAWRIAENRWSAMRYGLEGEMADPRTGEREPTRERVARLGWRLESNGSARQRAVFAESGAVGVARALADAFLG
jgi:glutamate---cysteine ligase / carboxylate-amine ligase